MVKIITSLEIHWANVFEKNDRNSGDISPEYDLWAGERG